MDLFKAPEIGVVRPWFAPRADYGRANMNITLRLYRPDDFEALHKAVSDFDVVKMLASWPFPAEEELTRMRLNSDAAKEGKVSAVIVDGVYAGGIGIVDDELGYFLAKPYWGQGVMSTAVSLKIAEFFSDPKKTVLKSCVFQGNPASARILENNGFQFAKECRDFSKARNSEVIAIHYELLRADWEKRKARK